MKVIIQKSDMMPLSGLTTESVLNCRKKAVQKHAELNIYASNYDPLKNSENEIYSAIESKKEWTKGAEYFLSNPYRLIILTYAGYVMPVGENKLKNKDLKFSPGLIEECYMHDDAKKWFEKLYKTKQIVEVRMVNAYDAGFEYATIDKKNSLNIDFKYSNSKTNIANSIKSKPGFYHVGAYDKNNYSPVDPESRIKIKHLNADTKIVVKLWRTKPQNQSQEADFVYLIKIQP